MFQCQQEAPQEEENAGGDAEGDDADAEEDDDDDDDEDDADENAEEEEEVDLFQKLADTKSEADQGFVSPEEYSASKKSVSACAWVPMVLLTRLFSGEIMALDLH